MTIENQNLSVYRGETKDFIVTIYDDLGAPKDLSIASGILWEVVDRNTGIQKIYKTLADDIAVTDALGGIITISLEPEDTQNMEPQNWYYHLITVVDTASNTSVVTTGSFEVKATRLFNLGYLIPFVRLSIGDTSPSTYRYTDEWVRVALVGAVQTMGSWWADNRYLIDADNQVYRNPLVLYWEYAEPPIIQYGDERPIILMASIILLEGSLQNSSWDLASWRDSEIQFSNLEGGRSRNDNLDRLYKELQSLVTPPAKKLAWAVKGHLPGYTQNLVEY